MKLFLRALRWFRPDAPRLAAIGGLLVVSVVLNLLKPWPLALIVDVLLTGKRTPPEWLPQFDSPQQPLLLLCAAALALHLIQGAVSALKDYLAIGVGLRGLQRARNDVFAALQRLSLRFHLGSRGGDLIHRAAWDTYSFQTLFQQGLVTSAAALLALVLMIVVMARMDISLTLAALVAVPLLLLSIRFFGRHMNERGAAAQAADSAVTTLVQQNIAALPLVQSYTRESHEEEKFTAQTATARESRLAQHGWELLYWLGVTVVFGAATAAIIYLGASRVMAGGLSVGELLIFLAYLGQLYEPLNQLSHVGATIANANAGAARVFELLDTEPEIQDRPGARPVLREGARPETSSQENPAPHLTRGQVSFERVNFSYRAGEPVLREISFALAPGERVAVIGPSGVGKTTLMNLLPRFHDPDGGAVRLDGVDLRELRLRDLRAQIAVVHQEPVLLPATLAENIAYGRPGATLADIEAAARAANAHGFIEKLPQKYQTSVGDGAARLSVGERQRISIARAFLKDAPILLLDEPTSALDAESEAAVVESLFALMRGRTTLMVAHRLTTIRRVDRILVIEAGRVAESGSPEALLRAGGYYARVVSGQAELG